MQIAGRRIHIAGSASSTTKPELIKYAHELVDHLVRVLAAEGATFLVGIGKEPTIQTSSFTSIPIIFDYTVLTAARDCLKTATVPATGEQGKLISVVVSGKTESQIPESHRPTWEELLLADAVKVDSIDAGWVSGAVRRIRQSELGDVLIALGGGEGTEHLAQLYVMAGKPVIPLDLALGASTEDGSGGASMLASRALAEPRQFARFSDPDAAGRLFYGTTTRAGERPIEEIVDSILNLLQGLASPTAFYVRLLNPTIPLFDHVERFFRKVVDPVINEFGYEPIEMGRGVNEYAWMNEAIFDSLHHSAVVIVDLTGLRNNCFMELGYALGHAKRVILTAMRGTDLPFDANMIECHKWPTSRKNELRINDFKGYWIRNIGRPPIVKERQVL